MKVGCCGCFPWPPLLIRHDSRWKVRWDLMILVISVWNCFTIPVDIAFQPAVFDTKPSEIFNHIVDAVFAVDIVLQFRTSILDEISGEWIT